MKKSLILICSCVIFSMKLSAQDAQNNVRFFVETSSDSVLLGNYIEVTFKLENAKGNQFEAPAFVGFDIVGGPNQSSSISIVNGATTQSVAYSYYLQPKEVGSYFIEPAFIEADGKTLGTEPIEILVADNPDGIIQSPKKKSRDLFGDDFFNFQKDDFFGFPKDEFFNFPKMPDSKKEEDSKKNKKKRKIYKI